MLFIVFDSFFNLANPNHCDFLCLEKFIEKIPKYIIFL